MQAYMQFIISIELLLIFKLIRANAKTEELNLFAQTLLKCKHLNPGLHFLLFYSKPSSCAYKILSCYSFLPPVKAACLDYDQHSACIVSISSE